MTDIRPPSNASCPPGELMADYGSVKWITWCSRYQGILSSMSLDCLSNDLQDLPLEREDGNTLSGFCPTWEDVVSCIQGKLTPYEQVAFSSAQVILGIGPPLLSLIAPSVGELCMLSSNRPILSLLISLGAPSSFCFRALTYDDPLECLKPQRTFFARHPLRNKGSNSRALIIATSFFEYLLILTAAANVVHAAWTLGQQTILSWKAESSYLPLLWTILAFTVQLMSSQTWRFSNTMRATRAEEQRSSNRGPAGAIWRWFATEVTPSAARKKRGFLKHYRKAEPRPIVFVNIFVQLLSLFLVLYGTFTLSSCLLIGIRDAFYFALRFFFSALVCRVILMIELSGMSAVENEYEKIAEESGDQWVEL